MAGQILVPLDRKDRLKEILPCLEDIAQPGMRVVFLIPDHIDGFGCLLHHKGMMETGLYTALAVKKLADQYMAENRRDSVKQKVFLASEGLRKRGVDIAVEFYTGSLRSALKRYPLAGDAQIMTPTRSLALIEVLYVLSGFFKRRRVSSVLLHPLMGRSK
ncbi:MAG: hypothetical protein HY645_04155 [Acidobacteria bacterium]|nr:hypothetical protein [Acidobacteriota bacterium]